MERAEVDILLAIAKSYYDGFRVNKQKGDDWHKVLKGYSFTTLEKNLRVHALRSSHPPKVADLIRGPYRDPGTRAVADRPETELISWTK